jgi:hypothetical protein
VDEMTNPIEKGIIEYLKKHENDLNWKFVLGKKTYTAKQLIEEIKKKKKLKDFIIEEVSKFAFEQLTKETK